MLGFCLNLGTDLFFPHNFHLSVVIIL